MGDPVSFLLEQCTGLLIVLYIYRDKYDLCQHEDFIISGNEHPAEFPPVDKLEINTDELLVFDSTTNTSRQEPEKIIPFVCDFIAEYINSDVLVGVLTNILLNFFFSKSFDSVM